MAEVTVELGHLLERTDFELFDFEYEFDDPSMKAELEQAIIDFFYFYEIGQETPDRFKHQFKARFKRTIGYYNKLHNTTLLEYNPLINYKISEALEQLANTSSNQDTLNDTTGNNTTEVTGTTSDDENVNVTNTRTDDLTASSDATRTDNLSSTSDTTRTDNLTQNTTSNEVTSDYPQQPIAGDYQDGERDTTTDTTNSGTQDTATNTSNTGTQDTTNTTTNTGTVSDNGDSTTSRSGTEDQTTTQGHSTNITANVSETGNTDMSYDKTIEGITGVSYQELVQMERTNIVRMTTALINEMKPCFILVY